MMKFNFFLSGLWMFAAFHAPAAVRYVDLNSATPTPPYTGWATAATNIQDAVDVAAAGDEVLVTNGVYQSGVNNFGGWSNRVALTKPLTLRSVNGPLVTSIVGYQVPVKTNGFESVRCVFLATGAVISGFTITNGSSMGNGGGVFCQDASAVVSNCIITGNSSSSQGGGCAGGVFQNCVLASNWSWRGGGAANAALVNCIVAGNSAPDSGFGVYGVGGGAYGGTLTNCTVVGNNALFYGGGVYSSWVYNSIAYYNRSHDYDNYRDCFIAYCCTTPRPNTIGPSSNITAPPVFANTNAWADLRLLPNSPCINAGFNRHAVSGNDLGGNSRVVAGTVDMGAYEFQSPTSIISYAWLQSFALPFDGSVDYVDSDLDGLNNWQEWVAGTVPTSALSALRLLNPSNEASGILVTWQSVFGKHYYLERATDLGAESFFSLLSSNILALSGTTRFTDTNAIGPGPFFYRVGVQQ